MQVMCGRFVSSSPPSQIAEYFGAEVADTTALEANYNVAPTNDVYVVYAEGGLRRLDAFHWGLVPSWAKDISVGNRMINARSETLAGKPAFKKLFATKRCIVPVDGFYEWKDAPMNVKWLLVGSRGVGRGLGRCSAGGIGASRVRSCLRLAGVRRRRGWRGRSGVAR